VEHEERADELMEEADRLERASKQLEDDIHGAREDWEAKKKDEQVPGAMEDAGAPEEEDAGEGGDSPA
jgi:hypothetical protein